jgi:CRP/FNR family transcriptional regulator
MRQEENRPLSQEENRPLSHPNGRVIYSLLSLAKQYHPEKQEELQICITHEELANFVGTNRVTVTNVLNYLETNDLIKKSRKKISIMNYKKLKSLLDQQELI